MFQKGKELECIFHTEGAFYFLETAGRNQFCRSLATVRRIGTDSETVDALFVLQNPGKSMPIDVHMAPLVIDWTEEIPLVPAKPDPTIHQVMRLMERRQWNFVQIINLTDLRCAEFADYKERIEFMDRYFDQSHRIFSIYREDELTSCVENAEVVIAGWGTKTYNLDAAQYAYMILNRMCTVEGLRADTHPLFSHPYPMLQRKCIEWLDDMDKLLDRRVLVG